MTERLERAARDGFLPVTVDAVGPGQRGRLALTIEAAIERTLQRRGACSPGVAAAADLALSLADQLYRARLIEHRGIALALGTLGGIADAHHCLDPEDSAVLRYLLTASALHPIRLYLSASDRELRAFMVPVALQELMPGPSRSPLPCLETAVPPAVAPAVAQSVATMQASSFERGAPEDDVAVTEDDVLDALTPPPSDASGIDLTPPSVADFAVTEPEVTAPAVMAVTAPAVTVTEPAVTASAVTAPAVTVTEPAVTAPKVPRAPSARAVRPARPEPAPREVAAAAAAPAPSEPELDSDDEDERPLTPPPPEPFVRGPLYENAASEWRRWATELEAARGPKPLGVIERMYVTNYVPLADAVARGVADASAKRVLGAWSASFENSYREAFDALRVRGKRPTMVLDVPEVALRIGRLHGARRVELIAVDGLRFDLGLRVEQRIRWRLGREVALTERLLLWSALPATTDVQLELLGRGPEALATWTGEVTSEVPVARGRNARSLRRVKVGRRDLLKLDLVEASLMEPGRSEAERLDDLADDVSEVLAGALSRLPPRTLAVVFGDHGFQLDALDAGTAAAHHGGGSPEEVLVPAFAWLVGGVH